MRLNASRVFNSDVHVTAARSRALQPVVNTVLVVDVEQLVFDPGDLFGGLPPALPLQRVLPVDGRQAHHGLLPYTPLKGSSR